MRIRTALVAALLFTLAISSGAAPVARAQSATPPPVSTRASVSGKVLDAATGKPLSFANVLVVGTALGANTADDGSFRVDGVATGPQKLRVSYLGYETEVRELALGPEGAHDLEFRMKSTTATRTKEVVVSGQRPLVEVDKAATIRSFNEEELQALTIDPTLDSVVEQQPGVTKDNDQIHIRGGRSEETLFIVDGVQMRDLLSGESSGSNVSARSVAEVNIITGGFDAKYGQALSGVIEAKLKDGSQDFGGYLGFATDRVTNDWDTDLWDFQLHGPLRGVDRLLSPLAGQGSERPTFYLNLASDLTNGHLPSIKDLPGDKGLRSSYEDHFLNGFTYGNFFYPRAANDWRLLFKTAWKASNRHKFALSVTKSLGFDQGFNDVDVSEVNRNRINYPWSWVDRLDRYYTVSKDQNSVSLAWTHVMRPTLFHTLKATRYFSGRSQNVAGLLWNEYDTDFDSNHAEEGTDRPYFRDYGDAADFRDRYVETWGLDWEWQHRHGRHDIQWGGRAQYEDVQYLSIDATSVTKDRPLGDEYDLFHVYPTTGAFYLQDRLDYEGLIAGIGLRYDYWFPGQQVENLYDRMDRPTITEETREEFLDSTHGLFGRRFKGHFSPRIQVSHPITQRDHLFFNYGHFTQRPPYFYVYAKSSSQSSEEFPLIGNPNLDPEVSVQYELGAGHQLRPDMAIKTSLFYKDIYDYPTSTTLVLRDRTTSRSNFFIYRNLDYARARGIELELRRRSTSHASWALAYTYSVVKGKSSDPNKLKIVQGSGGDARETSLEEEFMWWNRPHKFSAWFDYRVRPGESGPELLGVRIPSDVGLNLYVKFESGRAYTPQDVFGNDTGPSYSRNGPFESVVNGTLKKGFDLGQRRLELTLQGWNLFDHRTLLVVDPSTGEKHVPGEGSLIGDRSPATVARWLDPSQLSEPRHFRIGAGMEF